MSSVSPENHDRNDSLSSLPPKGLQLKSILKSSALTSLVVFLLNLIITVLTLAFLTGDVLAFLDLFFLLETGVLFMLSGIHALFGTSPSLNLLLGKILGDKERPLRIDPMNAIHRAIDYLVAAISVYITSYLGFLIALHVYL